MMPSTPLPLAEGASLAVLDLDFLRLVGLDLFACHVHFAQHGSIGMQNDLQGLLASRFSQHSNLALVCLSWRT